jgi:hypothetical protein
LKFTVIPSNSLSNEDKCTVGPAVAFAEIAPESGFSLFTTPITLRPFGAVGEGRSEKGEVEGWMVGFDWKYYCWKE